MSRPRNDLRDVVVPLLFALGVAALGYVFLLYAALHDVPCRGGSTHACAMVDLWGGGGAAALYAGGSVAGVMAVAPVIAHALARWSRARRPSSR